jgi:hypothetical protein
MMPNTDNRHIISMKSQGFSQTPQEIMDEYSGLSVGQYTAYPSEWNYCLNGRCVVRPSVTVNLVPIIIEYFQRLFDWQD